MSNESRLDLRVNFNRTRAFLYGESVFTTIRVVNGRLTFKDWHIERLLKSAEWLWPNTLHQAKDLLEDLSPPGADGVWRLTLTAQVRSRQAPDEFELILDDWWSEDIPKLQNLKLRTVKSSPRPDEWPSFLKSGDYLSRMVASRHLGKDELALFYVDEKVCELLHANVFFIKENKIFTPSLSANTLEGLGRRRVMTLVPVIECEIKKDELGEFSSAFAVNALRGLTNIDRIDEKLLSRHSVIDQIQREFFDVKS